MATDLKHEASADGERAPEEFPPTEPALRSRTNSRSPQESTRPLPWEYRRPPILEVATQYGDYHGVPIGLFSDKTLLMRNDGAIQFLENASILRRERLDEEFQTIDVRVLMTQLRREFGSHYQVRWNPPYVVVAGQQSIDMWAQRFKSFQQSMQLYCATVGIPLKQPEFPLIAIVFDTQREFMDFSRSVRDEMPKNCAGYYSQKTNRIVLYRSDPDDESATLETICHEATHQLAFNLGVHQRLTEAPLWAVEGLAMMFEGKRFSDLKNRDTSTFWPQSQPRVWKRLSNDPAMVKRIIDRLLQSDDPFKTQTSEAYSVSWAMSIYFSQRMKPQYTAYLKRIAALPPFEPYPASRRLSDFSRAFGNDTSVITRNLIRHLETLP